MSFKGIKSVHHPSYTEPIAWHDYNCGHCNKQVNGYVVATYDLVSGPIKWLLCTGCGNGSVITRENILYPSSLSGPNLDGLPSEISVAYNEARKDYSINSFTSCELICRKILMHVGVEKGAKEGDTFESYISHLEKLGYVTPPMKPWVDLIRQHGNKSTHKLENPDQKRAESTLMFTAELLRLVYEMEHRTNQYTKTTP